MLVTMPTDEFAVSLGSDEKGIPIMAEAGFDGFDFSMERIVSNAQFPYTYVMDRPDYREYARYLRNLGNAHGLSCSVAHAPTVAHLVTPELYAPLLQKIIRAVESSAILGSGILVVLLLPHRNPLQPVQQEWNFKLFRDLIPFARDFGIKIAMENLIEWPDHRIDGPSIHRQPEEFRRFFDTLDSEWLTICLDFGHAVCAGADVPAMIRGLGKERIAMLHVHDNDLKADHHGMPYMGRIPMDDCIQALREIGFDGVLDLEVDINRYPPELIPAAARLVCQTGQYLRKRILEPL